MKQSRKQKDKIPLCKKVRVAYVSEHGARNLSTNRGNEIVASLYRYGSFLFGSFGRDSGQKRGTVHLSDVPQQLGLGCNEEIGSVR
jgi:hypothetical protein